MDTKEAEAKISSLIAEGEVDDAARLAEKLGDTKKAEKYYNQYQKREFTPYGH